MENYGNQNSEQLAAKNYTNSWINYVMSQCVNQYNVLRYGLAENWILIN